MKQRLQNDLLDYFGLSEPPFSITPDPKFLFMSEHHKEAFAHLLYSLQGSNGFVLLTGEVGAGKTTLCRALLTELPENVDLALILNPRLTARDLAAAICDDLGVKYDKSAGSIKDIVAALNDHLLVANGEGRQTIVLIDEAQNLSVDVLEEIRLLTNLETETRKLLQIVLVGQPELRDILEKAELRQLAQRVTARYHLDILLAADTGEYIRHRLKVAGRDPALFLPSAIKCLYRQTGGVPRLMNTVADRALMGCYARNEMLISGRHVNRAAVEVLGRSKKVASRRRYWAALAATVVLGIAVTLSGPRGFAELIEPVAEVFAGMRSKPAASPMVVDSVPTPKAAPETPPNPAREVLVGGVASAVVTVETPAVATAAATAQHTAPLSDPAPAVPAFPAAATPALPTAVPLPPAVVGNTDLNGDEGVVAASVSTTASAQPIATELLSAADEPAADETAVDPIVTQDAVVVAEPGVEAEVPDKGAVVAAASTSPVVSSVNTPVEGPPPSTEAQDTLERAPAAEIGGGYEWAMQTLFATWGVDFETLKGLSACERAVSADLRCFQSNGASLSRLGIYDHPFVARMSRGELQGKFLVVVGITADAVLLTPVSGESVAELGKELFSRGWNGEYLLLWRPPPVLRGDSFIWRGEESERVRWVQQRLAAIPALAPELKLSGEYNQATEQAVRRLQANRGISVDGVVGVETLIQLNLLGGESGPGLQRALAGQ